MIVVEYKTDDFGKLMEYISCIEKKAKCIKEILQEDTLNERAPHVKGRRMYDDDDYEERDSYKSSKKYISRYE